MEGPLEIIWHEMDPLPHVEDRVRDRVGRLEKFFDRIIGIHVVIEEAHHRHRVGNQYEVRLEVTVPGNVLTVNRKPGDVNAHADPLVAVRDAFEAMERQLRKWKEQHSGRPEVAESPEEDEPADDEEGEGGNLGPMAADGESGAIAVTDGRLIYFHRNAVVDGRFDDLDVGDPVELMIAPEDDAQNLHASTVRPISKAEFLNAPR